MRHLFAIAVLLAVLPLAACEDPNSFRPDPVLVTDTLVLGAPPLATDVPSALDVVPSGTDIVGRHPERAEEAEQWDLVLRERNGQLALVPAAVLGIRGVRGTLSRAGITRARNQQFEALREAPRREEFVTDSAVVLQVGSVYAVRSREVAGGYAGCEFYGKLQPLAVEPAAGTVRLQIVVNTNCSDPRLVPED